MRKFNLIVTCPRGAELNAIYDIRDLLEEAGDAEAEAWETGVAGLILAKTSLNPVEAVEKIRRYVRENPSRAGVVKRVIPIQRSIPAELGEIAAAVGELSYLIGREESFRITVEKRHTRLSSRQIIAETARLIDRKVDLENPDKIVLIEIVGPVAGVSILKPDSIVNLEREAEEALREA